MIIYTVIGRARDAAILVEVSDGELTGNAPQVTAMLLGHLRDHPDLVAEGERKTFVQKASAQQNAQPDPYDLVSLFIDSCAAAFGQADNIAEADVLQDDHYFHVMLKQGVYYCCIGDDPDLRDQKVNFAYLELIAEEFVKRHRPRRIDTCNAYALDKNFKPTVRSAVHYHNVNHKSIAREDHVQKLHAKLANMQQVMGRNIDLLLERGENVDKLMDKSTALEQDAALFKKKAVVIRRRTQRKFYFMMTLYIVIGMLFLYMFTAGVCGVGFQYCRVGKEDNKGDADASGSDSSGGQAANGDGQAANGGN